METPYHYRNKVQAAFAYDTSAGGDHQRVYQSSTHKIVPIDSCQTEDETADRIIVSIRGAAEGLSSSRPMTRTRAGAFCATCW